MAEKIMNERIKYDSTQAKKGDDDSEVQFAKLLKRKEQMSTEN